MAFAKSFLRGATAALLASSAHAAHADVAPPDGITLADPIDVAPTAASTTQINVANPTFATNGTDALACFTESSPSARLACARYTGAGTVLDPDSIVLDASLGHATRPVVSWDGTRYTILEGTSGQHLDPATGALDAPFTLPAATGAPVAAGGGFTLTLSGTSATVYDGTLTAVGTVTIPATVAQGQTFQPASAAYSSGTFLVVWITSSWTAVGVRISSAGALLDATPIVIDPGNPYAGADGGPNAYLQSLVAGGGDAGFFVAWGDPRAGVDFNTYGTAVGCDGSVAVPGGGFVTKDAAPASISGAAGTFWVSSISSPTNGSVFVTPVSTGGADAGATVGATVTASAANDYPGLAVVATKAGAFFGWTQQLSVLGITPMMALSAERIDTAGHVLDAQPAWLSSMLVAASQVAITASPTGYLVTWVENGATLAARLGPDGTPIDYPKAPGSAVSSLGGDYVGVGGSYLTQLPPTGAAETFYTGKGTSFTSILCTGDRCLIGGYNTAETIALGGLVLNASFPVAPLSIAATDGHSFLSLGSVATDGGGTIPSAQIVGPDGSLGATSALGQDWSGYWPGPAAWGVDRYLVMRSKTGFNRVAADGSLLEPEANLAIGWDESPGVVWDGRAFLYVGSPVAENSTDHPQAHAVEIPASGPATMAGDFTLWHAPLAGGVGAEMAIASHAQGDVLVVALEPRGGSGTARPVTRRIQVRMDADAGVDGGEDAGLPDGGSDAASDASGGDDGGTVIADAGALDAGIDATASTPGDAGVDDDAGSLTPVADAAVASDGGDASDVARAIHPDGGCGCATAGRESPSSGEVGGIGVVVGLAFVARRRRRRRN